MLREESVQRPHERVGRFDVGAVPDGELDELGVEICASSREPAIEMGSKVPWRIKV